MGGLGTSGDLGSEPANGRVADKVARRAAVNNYGGRDGDCGMYQCKVTGALVLGKSR